MPGKVNVKVTLHNIKARFRVDKPITAFAQVLGQPRSVHNFTVHRGRGRVTFTVFESSQWVNLTGVRRWHQLLEEARIFCREFGLALVEDSIIVDTTTSAGNLPNVDRSLLSRLAIDYRSSARSCPFSIGVRTENFPSLHFRQRKRYRCETQDPSERVRPSLTLFTTGKFIILGAKTRSQILNTFEGVTDWLHSQGWIGQPLSHESAVMAAENMSCQSPSAMLWEEMEVEEETDMSYERDSRMTMELDTQYQQSFEDACACGTGG